ncbi:MAG: septum formation initiator family protein [Roseiflexus sp.]|nr:septum formation initiator family protein [Roseiflexus sp.]MCS7290282.1 septum formation initiator family protein [Roseiflexus sp.]MDW8146036.1 septum formation initiator family protein [Roseiflexaceae bacterium]MDW8231302.1 septum formation initiator family protein [Roseiflexaceae bacterium]
MPRSRHQPAHSRTFRERLRLGRAGTHALTLVMVVLSLWMMASFVGQIMTGAQLEQRRATLVAENARIEATNRALLDQVEYAESPAYAEQIAREQLGLAAEGDTVLLPTFEDRPASKATPTPVALPAPTPQLNWRAWIQALTTGDTP